MMNLIYDINNYFFNPYAVPYFIVGALTFAEGIFILIQNRKSLVNVSYMLSCVAVMLWLVGLGAIYSAKYEEMSIFWAKYFSFLGIIFITPTIHFFSICWRSTLLYRQGIKKDLAAVIFNFACALALYFLCISSDFVVKGVWRYPWGFYPKAGIAYFLLIAWFFVLMVLSIKNFMYVYRLEEIPIKKKQAKTIIMAFSIAFIGSLEFLPNYGVGFYLLAFIPVFICITIVGYSIIRYRLMDIETVFHKTVAWLFTSIALIAPFVILFYLTAPWYANLNIVGASGFLGILFLAFLFFVKAFQPKVDHFFQRRQANLEQISTRFTEDLVHLKGLSQLTQRIEDTIRDTLYSQRIDIFIYHASAGREIYKLANAISVDNEVRELSSTEPFLMWLAENNKIAYKEFIDLDPDYTAVRKEARDYFNLTQAIVVVPLVLNDKLLGIINLTRKANLRRYSAADFHFLTMLKNQSTIAISNSLLYENIEEQVRLRTEELVEVQKQLVQAEKLATVGILAGGVAHEINNPLTAILTNVQMLLSDNSLDDKLDKESLELIEEATKRCRTIVQKLMTYAKKPLEAAGVSEVDLLDVINKVSSFLSYQLEQENIEMVVKAKKDSYLITGNHNELEQVVTNIVLNARDAIKHVKKNGQIHVWLSKSSGNIIITIKDEGIGMPKEIISKIFDPFFTTKDVGKGLGLGLSICQAIVEKHNGIISVQSEPQKGSIFTIQLPEAYYIKKMAKEG